MRALCITFMLLLLFSACRKDDIDLDWEAVEMPVDQPVRCIEAWGDDFVIGGGARDGNGFVCVASADFSSISVLRNDLVSPVFDLIQHEGRWYYGLDGGELWFSDGSVPNDTFRQFYFSESDWLGDLYTKPLRRFASREGVLMGVTGGGNSFGALLQNFDSLQSWNPLEFDNEMRTVFIWPEEPFRAWIAGNGRLMQLIEPAGEWKRIRLDDSFIADLHFFTPTFGVALEVDGNILKTSTSGRIWTHVDSEENNRFMNRLVSDGEGRYIALGNKGVVGISENQGDSWRWSVIENKPDLYDALFLNGRVIVTTGEGEVLTTAWPPQD